MVAFQRKLSVVGLNALSARQSTGHLFVIVGNVRFRNVPKGGAIATRILRLVAKLI